MDTYTLYWIKCKHMKNPYKEGYIGVTKRDPYIRFKEHIKNHPEIDTACEIEILNEGNKQYISNLEKKYRSKSNIGWNKSPGGLSGGRPTGIHTSGWKYSESNKEKRSLLSQGENNPMYGKTASEEQRAAVSKAHLGKKKKYKVAMNWPIMNGKDNPRARKVLAEGVVYDTIKDCCDAYGLKNHNAIRYRCKNDKWTEWQFV